MKARDKRHHLKWQHRAQKKRRRLLWREVMREAKVIELGHQEGPNYYAGFRFIEISRPDPLRSSDPQGHNIWLPPDQTPPAPS